jgi:hypothetical protein
MLNHSADSFGDFMGHNIRDPYNATPVWTFREYLYGCIVVNQGLAASRPRMAAGLIVDGDDQFTHDHSVCKRYDSPVTFLFTIRDKARYQTLMNGAHIADRVPDKFFTPLDRNFLVDSSHSLSFQPVESVHSSIADVNCQFPARCHHFK